MGTKLAKALGLLFYMLILGILFRLDWALFFKPRPFLSVFLGMLILTAFQYRKGDKKEEIIAALRWNVILASFLAALISVFGASNARLSDIGSLSFTEHLLPLLYGSLLYMILEILFGGRPPHSPEGKNQDIMPALTATETAEQVFRVFVFTRRECHVAQKLLSDMSNKEIAADLYISEATVKKHIQNIYQKTSVSDRAGFRNIYYEQARQIK